MGAGPPPHPGASVSAAEDNVAVEIIWWASQQIIVANADQNRQRGGALLTTVIDRLRSGLPAGLDELATLGRTDAAPAAETTFWPTSTTVLPAGRPRPSTAASRPCGATLPGSATSATTASAHCSTTELSHLKLEEEPVNGLLSSILRVREPRSF